MDIKITFDISDKLDGALARIANAIQAVTVQAAPAPICEPVVCECTIGGEDNAPADGEILPVETPEPLDVPKPAEEEKAAPEPKIEAVAAPDDEPAKPKRSHRKKAEPEKVAEPEPEKVEAPAPEPEKPAEPEPEPEPEPEKVEAPEPPKAEAATEKPAEPEAPALDIDAVRAVCLKASKKGKTKVITDFLAAHDAASLPKLDPKFYADLVATVEAAL